MAFVKLDCGMLNSSIWIDREAREIFVTALLLAHPYEVREPMNELAINEIKDTGFIVPTGWYGFVPAASVGIISRCGMGRKEGLEALERLASPDPESRSKEYEGRRMVRVDGGFIILNYERYRERDNTTAERSKRYRLKLKIKKSLKKPSVN